MYRFLKFLMVFMMLVFVAPAFVSAGIWQLEKRPGSWRTADWGSSGLLRSASETKEAVVYLMAARTGGL